MTYDPLANLHLGIPAEALVLIYPQLGDYCSPSVARHSLLLPTILSIALLMLPPGAPIIQENGWRQLARTLECTDRCYELPMTAVPVSIQFD